MKRFSKITTTQLARICGVSQGTVDRALHNRDDINPETRARILEIAKENDYSPNVQMDNQAGSMLIGVVLFDLFNEYFSNKLYFNKKYLSQYSLELTSSGIDGGFLRCKKSFGEFLTSELVDNTCLACAPHSFSLK